MAITVFDAVGRFTADTSELDRFIAKLERGLSTAEEKAAAAAIANKNAQNQLRDAFKALNAEGGNTVDNQTRYAEALKQSTLAHQAAARAGVQLKDSLGIVKNSTREATGEAALLGEAFGIHLPRHVRSFIAEIPGVASVLKGLFAVTAVGFLIDALVQIPGKIHDITSALAGWGEEAQKTYDAQIKLNQAFLDQSRTREEAHVRENERGLTGIALTKQQIANDGTILEIQRQRISQDGELKGLLEQQAEKLRNHIDLWKGISLSQQAAFVAQKLGLNDSQERLAVLEKSIKALDDSVTKQAKDRKDLEQKSADAESQLRQQGLQQSIAVEVAKSQATKNRIDAQIAFGQQAALLELSQTRLTVYDQARIQKEAEDDRFHAAEQDLQRRIVQAKRDPTKNPAEIARLNGELEALEIQHDARQLEIEVNFLRTRQQLIDKAAAQLKKEVEAGKFDAPIAGTIELSVATKAIVQADELLARLGVTTARTSQELGAAEAAFNLLSQTMGSGIKIEDLLSASTEDFRKTLVNLSNDEISGLHAVLLARLAYAESFGEPTTKIISEISAVEQAMGKQGLAIDRATTAAGKWASFWKGQGFSTGIQIAKVTDLGRIAVMELTQGFVSVLEQAVTSSDGVGKAFELMVARILIGIAKESAIQALKHHANAVADFALAAALAPFDPGAAAFLTAAGHLENIAAIEYAAIGGGALAGGLALEALASGGGGSSSGKSNSESPQAASGAGQGPAQRPVPPPPNVQHLAIFPQAITAAVADSYAAQVVIVDRGASQGSGASEPAIINHHYHNTWNIEGVISDDKLDKVIQKIDHRVKNNGVPLTSSNTHRVTKKS